MYSFISKKSGPFDSWKTKIRNVLSNLTLLIFPKKIHLLYGVGGLESTREEERVSSILRALDLKYTWYFMGIDGVRRRPNQIFLIHSGLKGNRREEDALRLSKRYGIEIRYFTDTSDLKSLTTAWATE